MNLGQVIEIADSEDDESDGEYSSSGYGIMTAATSSPKNSFISHPPPPPPITITYKLEDADIYTDDLPPLCRKSGDDTSTSSINCRSLRLQMLAATDSSTSNSELVSLSHMRQDEYPPFVADDCASAPSTAHPVIWTQLNHHGHQIGDLSGQAGSSPLLSMSTNQINWHHSTPTKEVADLSATPGNNTPFLPDMAGSFVTGPKPPSSTKVTPISLGSCGSNHSNDLWSPPTGEIKSHRAKTAESKPPNTKRDKKKKRANTHNNEITESTPQPLTLKEEPPSGSSSDFSKPLPAIDSRDYNKDSPTTNSINASLNIGLCKNEDKQVNSYPTLDASTEGTSTCGSSQVQNLPPNPESQELDKLPAVITTNPIPNSVHDDTSFPTRIRVSPLSPKRPKYRVGLSKRARVEPLHAYLKK